MPKKLCAISLVVLALSPFTAPFQTCDFADVAGSARDDAASVTTPTVAQPSLPDDAGSVVPPLTTETERVKRAPASGLVIWNAVAPPRSIFLRRLIASRSRLNAYAALPSVLRL
jgi:hypothetical protein